MTDAHILGFVAAALISIVVAVVLTPRSDYENVKEEVEKKTYKGGK